MIGPKGTARTAPISSGVEYRMDADTICNESKDYAANTTSFRIIGDVHGRIQDYYAVADDADLSIQIGDMGLGFRGVSLEPNPAHRFFRGNHDSPQACRDHPNYMGDWGYDEAFDLFWFAGADSIDRYIRREGVSWWRDEELSVQEFQEALDLYERVRPSVVLSHDGPQDFVATLFGIRDRSRTRQALQAAYELWQPRLWAFGHHHSPRDFVTREDTRFVCLPELALIDLELPLAPSGDGRQPPVVLYSPRPRSKEREFPEGFDRALAAVRGIVDMPDGRLTLLTRVCLQNDGRLSRTKRERHFRELTDEQVGWIEEAVRTETQEGQNA